MKPMQTPPNPIDMRNLIIASVLCTALLFIWQVMYQNPKEAARRAAFEMQQAQIQQKPIVNESGDVVLPQPQGETTAAGEMVSSRPRTELLQETPRVRINSPAVHGSINLDGLRFDDLTLVRHRVSVDKDSPEVVLLTPAQSQERYFLQVGWLAASQGSGVELPPQNARWQANAETLTPEQPVTLTWTNAQGVVFRVLVTLDRDYLFTLRQEVVNNSSQAVSLMPYGLVNRSVPKDEQFASVLHLGPIGVMDGTLTEFSYKNLAEDGKQAFGDAKGWFGISDKYWLTAFIPQAGEGFTANFQHMSPRGQDRAQADYLAKPMQIAPGATGDYTVRLFAGAKELDVLDRYREELNLPLFDRALDFGVLYFLTKPTFMTLDYFYGLIGNFGLAILLFVVVLKIALFPLSNKSYRAMAQMRVLQPEIERIRKEYGNDKMRQQQEVMALWQRERVNPISGCLPMLIQIPIFFALYKVLLVTIEMRHAPFYGWIHDLSAPDPTNIFTLFGLLEWNPPAMLHIGLWPVIMCISMIFQQKMNPKPTDPVQAKVIGFLPYIFVVLFAKFPAGLLIYWAWNNTLSIVQQWVINKSYERHKKRKAAKLEFAEGKGS